LRLHWTMESLYERVARRAARLNVAKDFSSPEALNEYLKTHPDADRTKHKVDKSKAGPAKQETKPGGKPPAPKAPAAPPGAKPPVKPQAAPSAKKPPPIPEAAKKKPAPDETKKQPAPKAPAEEKKPAPKAPAEEKGHHDDHGHDDHDDHDEGHSAKGGRFDSWKKTLKGLKDSAVKFVEKAPKAVKSFLGEPEFRKAALKEAKNAITKLPKKAVHRLVETAKEEVHEFKAAGEGVKAMLSGKKMSKHQKHAFKQVATHMAIGAAAAGFAATGPLSGAAIFAKGLARHVALKSVKKALGNLHTMEEVSHIGHGVGHFFEHIASEGESKSVDPEEAMTNLILASVAKTMEQLKDEDFTKVLNGMGGGDEGDDDGDDADDDSDADSDTDDEDSKTADKTASLSVFRRYSRANDYYQEMLPKDLGALQRKVKKMMMQGYQPASICRALGVSETDLKGLLNTLRR